MLYTNQAKYQRWLTSKTYKIMMVNDACFHFQDSKQSWNSVTAAKRNLACVFLLKVFMGYLPVCHVCYWRINQRAQQRSQTALWLKSVTVLLILRSTQAWASISSLCSNNDVPHRCRLYHPYTPLTIHVHIASCYVLLSEDVHNTRPKWTSRQPSWLTWPWFAPRNRARARSVTSKCDSDK